MCYLSRLVESFIIDILSSEVARKEKGTKSEHLHVAIAIEMLHRISILLENKDNGM